jgi:murein L,D-transpeptidase YcbB/YkuD
MRVLLLSSAIAMAVLCPAKSVDATGWRRLSHQALDIRADQALSELVPREIRGIVGEGDPQLVFADPERAELREFYERSEYRTYWIDAASRPSSDGREALALLDRAPDEGLDPLDYHPKVLRSLTAQLEDGTATPVDLARFDVALSSGLLRYFRHVHQGRVDPRAIGFRLTGALDRHSFPALLRAATEQHRIADAAADLRPALVQYRMLRPMLARYRALAADPALTNPIPLAAAVHAGDSYSAVALVMRRLIALGDLPAGSAPETFGRYEGAVVDGVKHFQVRHGLTADGVLGKSTFAALSVPIAWRVRQIELALERLRWLPHLGDSRLLALNIPMFRLWAWDTIPPSGLPLFGMDVIVGRALNTQTPVFVEAMNEVTFRPYWNVPRSILRHEILPKLQLDQGYLQREDMEIVRGDGDNAQVIDVSAEALNDLRRGTLRVRQRPGPRNSLGLIKFVFPNEDDVYMHGTPAQVLFEQARRDFSHGCVRVEDPVKLAEWALQDRPEWTRDRILSATLGTKTIHVRLLHPIQVILFYTTASVMPEDGTIRFAEDLYGHDARLNRALVERQPGY